jgi:hypothetical protein
VLRQGMRYSKVIVSLLTLLKLLAAATITWSPVTPLLNAAFRQSAPSQILFSVTPRYVAYWNQHRNFLAEWPFKLVQVPSLSSTSRTAALWGSPIINHNSISIHLGELSNSVQFLQYAADTPQILIL